VKDFVSWRVYANTNAMLIIFLCYRGVSYCAARIPSSDALEPTEQPLCNPQVGRTFPCVEDCPVCNSDAAIVEGTFPGC
jgi:hypothetical protein